MRISSSVSCGFEFCVEEFLPVTRYSTVTPKAFAIFTAFSAVGSVDFSAR